MNSISAPPGIGIGTVVAVSIVIGLIVFFANEYSADQRYISHNSNASGAFQPKGNYVTVAQYDPVIKSLKDSTDMMSQQMKTTMSVTANLLRSVGFIRISPNTILLSFAPSGITTGFGGLPSCISKNSPLVILSGSPAFVNKVMAYKDTNPSSTILQATLAAVKSIGTESFRFRRYRQDATPVTAVTSQGSLTPYQTQFQATIGSLASADITTLSADDKALLTKFAAKYFFTIGEFDPKTGYPVVHNLTDLFSSVKDKMLTLLTPSSSSYQTILNDIYRYNPTLLNSC